MVYSASPQCEVVNLSPVLTLDWTSTSWSERVLNRQTGLMINPWLSEVSPPTEVKYGKHLAHTRFLPTGRSPSCLLSSPPHLSFCISSCEKQINSDYESVVQMWGYLLTNIFKLQKYKKIFFQFSEKSKKEHLNHIQYCYSNITDLTEARS